MTDLDASSRAGPPSRYVAYTPAKRSEIHDTDFKRLTRCYDPTGSEGMRIEDWHGRFAGRWEGSFVSPPPLLSPSRPIRRAHHG